MPLPNEYILLAITTIGIINTISRWSAIKDIVSRAQETKLKDLQDNLNSTRRKMEEWAYKFIQKEDFNPNDYVLKADYHEELARIYNRIETKQNK